MIRRALVLLVVVAALTVRATPAAAQLPPIIRKPIDAAKKSAAAANAQAKAMNDVDPSEPKQQQPAAAAAATAAQAPAGAGAPAAAKPGARIDPSASAAVQKAAPTPMPILPKGVEAARAAIKAQMAFYREEYAYSDDGRRDPFVSLLATSEIRPLLADLVLIGVIYDMAGRNSVASLLDATSGETYRVKAGNIIGRMKVAKIGLESITLNIDEFGFSRQETLLLDRTSRKAGQGSGRRSP